MPVLTDEEARAYVLERFPGTEFHGQYPGTKVKWSMTCPAGHACEPLMNSIRNGQGICGECGAERRGVARRLNEEQAIKRLREVDPGAIPLEPFARMNLPWQVQCGAGHHNLVLFNGLNGGFCRDCGREAARTKQLMPHDVAVSRVLERFPEAQPLSRYPGSGVAWDWLCPIGHVASFRFDNFVAGAGICRVCGVDKRRISPEEALTILDELLPGTVSLSEYPGRADLPWVIRCPEGHEKEVRLGNILYRGLAVCNDCNGVVRGYNPNKPGYFYVVEGFVDGPVVQFGITGNLRRRLSEHAKNGFRSTAHHVVESDDGYAIRAIETQVKHLLRQLAVPTLREAGYTFGGATETFRAEFFSLSSLVTSVAALSVSH